MENFIEILKSVLYGIVEGITEWLPISSTGQMILLEELLPMKVSESFWEMFLVVIQLGAIPAVVVLYWNKIFPFNFRNENRPFLRYDVFQLWFKILVACIPAAIVGLLFDDWLNAHLYNAVVVAIMLVLVGIAFIIIENRNRGNAAPAWTRCISCLSAMRSSSGCSGSSPRSSRALPVPARRSSAGS